MTINYEIAKANLENGRTDYKAYFKENGYFLEYGYSLILEGDLLNAKIIFKQQDSLRANWALRFIPFMTGNVEELPTYFQIRNFLEIDINLLIMGKQTGLISYILGGADILYSINCEVYKYIARVMMNNCYYDIGKKYLDDGFSKTENDPELHFMYCQYYITTSNFIKAIEHINKCLKVLPDYYPAIRMKEALLKI